MRKIALLLILAQLVLVACLESGREAGSQDPKLTSTGEPVGVGVGNKLLFANNSEPLAPAGGVDIFDLETGKKTSASLSERRVDVAAAAVGNRAFFVGGQLMPVTTNVVYSFTIDVYSADSDLWSSQTLLTARSVDNLAVVGTKIIVPGGNGGGANALSNFEIIDTADWSKSTKSLSVGRALMATVAVSGKVYFIGGVSCWSPACVTNTLDIYDTNTDSLSTIAMPRYRARHRAVVNGTKIYVGAGDDGTTALDVVDIFETLDNTWTTTTMSVHGSSTTAGSIGPYVFFAGGSADLAPQILSAISILDVSSGQWTQSEMSVGRYNMGLATKGSQAFLAGGAVSPGGTTDLIEVLEPTTGKVGSFSSR